MSANENRGLMWKVFDVALFVVTIGFAYYIGGLN